MSYLTRRTKGTCLTHDELDDSLDYIKNSKTDLGHQHTSSDVSDLGDLATQNTISSLQVDDSTSVGRALLTASTALAQRQALSVYGYYTREQLVTAVGDGFTGLNGTTITVEGLAYIWSTGATAISDLPGLLPYVWIFPDHFGKNTTPGSTDMSGAIQAAINYAAGITTGATVFFQEVKYAIASALTWKPNVSFDLGQSTTIVATAAMTAMLQTGVGSSGVRLRGAELRGGVWDADNKASRCILLKEFEYVKIRQASFIDCDGSYIEHDGTGAFASCYDLFVSGVRILRKDQATTAPANNYGFKFNGLSDSHFHDIVISGVERGFSGPLWASKIITVHVWNWWPTQGELKYGFHNSGGNNQFIGCQVDNSSTAAYYNGESRNYYTSCHLTLDNASFIPDGVPVGVYNASGKTCTVTNCNWNAQSSSYRIGKDIDGDLSGIQSVNNTFNNVVTVQGNRGALIATVDITTNAGSDPTINKSWNIASVCRNSDEDYTFTFTNNPIDTSYQVIAHFEPTSYPQYLLAPIIRERNAGSFRVQCVNSANTFVRPAKVTVTVRRV